MDKISNNYDGDGELPNNHNNVTFEDTDKIFVRLIEFDKLPNARLVSSLHVGGGYSIIVCIIIVKAFIY